MTVKNDCIHHTDCPNGQGYGRRYYKGTIQSSHRIAYCEANGIEISEIAKLVIRHQCDNPRCINPKHLVVGTQKQNVEDCIKRGRRKYAHGEKHYLAVLDKEKVKQIRLQYIPRSREFGTRALGKKYNVSQSTISDIVRGKNWKAVD